jgi:hypothetical protein
MGFENGEMVVRVVDLRVGFVTRVEQRDSATAYRVMFHGGETGAISEGDLVSAREW